MFGLDSILGAAGGIAGAAGGGGGPTSARTGELTSTNTFGPVSFGSKSTGGGLKPLTIALIIGGTLAGIWLWKRR